ncbi:MULTISPECIES: hypothetical protein [unclassified Methanoculleus]|jgi:hypothetical protein|nr:hypothetical protein [Methanoculleus sp. UBA377]
MNGTEMKTWRKDSETTIQEDVLHITIALEVHDYLKNRVGNIS